MRVARFPIAFRLKPFRRRPDTEREREKNPIFISSYDLRGSVQTSLVQMYQVDNIFFVYSPKSFKLQLRVTIINVFQNVTTVTQLG